jgi:hypothetical protein
MYTIKPDQVKNRLYVSLVGFFAVEEMKKCVDETIDATKKLKLGYDVVTDISQFKAGTPEVAKEIERAQAHFVTSGARRGIRVVGTSLLSGMQFKRTGSQAGYQSTNVATLEDAEKALAEV